MVRKGRENCHLELYETENNNDVLGFLMTN